MRILITGITGFAGSHLADYILKEKLGEIHAVKRWRSLTDNIEHFVDNPNVVTIERYRT